MAPDEYSLIGTIPHEISNLEDLGILMLDRCVLTGSIPSTLGLLENLYRLHLDSNQLTGSIPSELLTKATPEELYLNNNRLSGSVEEIEFLRELLILQIHNNAFTGTIPPDIGDIPGLCKGIFVIVCDAQVLFSPSSTCFSKPNRRRDHLYFVPGSLFESIMAVEFTLHVNNISGEMPDGVCDLRDTNGGPLKFLSADCAPLGNPKLSCECCTDCPANEE